VPPQPSFHRPSLPSPHPFPCSSPTTAPQGISPAAAFHTIPHAHREQGAGLTSAAPERRAALGGAAARSRAGCPPQQRERWRADTVRSVCSVSCGFPLHMRRSHSNGSSGGGSSSNRGGLDQRQPSRQLSSVETLSAAAPMHSVLPSKDESHDQQRWQQQQQQHKQQQQQQLLAPAARASPCTTGAFQALAAIPFHKLRLSGGSRNTPPLPPLNCTKQGWMRYCSGWARGMQTYWLKYTATAS